MATILTKDPIASLDGDERLYGVDDPAGTPADGTVTPEVLRTYMQANWTLTVDLTADVTGVLPIANGGTGASTASGARAALGVDAAGTDNSTDVTIAAGRDYITIAGQELTLGAVDLTTDVTGALPVANGGTGATTASGARTALGVDAAGTDNSTPVTLAGSLDYLTLSGQEITRNAIDLATDTTGTLGTASGGTGQTSLGAVDAADLGSGAATDGHVLTADGLGGAAWEAVSGGSGDFLADGTVAMTGAFDTDVGTFASGVADGASAVGFDFNTSNTIAATGGLLQRWRNNGVVKAYIDKDGYGSFPRLYFPNSFGADSTLRQGGYGTMRFVAGLASGINRTWYSVLFDVAGGGAGFAIRNQTGTTEHFYVSGDGGFGATELAADPDDPPEGKHVIWQSDGTGSGDDGDIMIKITAGGITKTITLVDFSTF